MANQPIEAPPGARRRSFWTWNLGSIAGIPIRVHLTLVILLAWIAATYALHGAGIGGTLIGVLVVAVIFATIVVHELGHALVARRFGYKTRDILLLPIGGIANLERMPEKPSQELAVALVGPAINLAIAAVLAVIIALSGTTTNLTQTTSVGGSVLATLMWVNIGLAVFNLLPAFPMDGGRALRALLAMWLGHTRATDVAAALGKGFAVLLGVFGLFYNPILVLIAVVVWLGASQERAMVHLRTALAGVPVSAAMLRKVETVSSDQRLEDAAALMLQGGQNQLPVVDHGTPIGVITRADVASALSRVGPNAPVSAAPRHEVVTVDVGESLDHVLDRLRQARDAVALVTDHGQPVGLVTPEHLAAYVALHEKRAA
jgi:Zn-dependent protease/CBS domain-containing protein